MRIGKERIIFNNYNDYTSWDDMQLDYDITINEICNFFDGKKCVLFGHVGLWNGIYQGCEIGNFIELYNKAITDCDYIKIYDINGHFNITCSHHDGTNHFEIKEVTNNGINYYDRWYYGSDNRTETQVNSQIIKRYSKLPHFSHKVYGCKLREYKESTKSDLINMINNNAKSFYC